MKTTDIQDDNNQQPDSHRRATANELKQLLRKKQEAKPPVPLTPEERAAMLQENKEALMEAELQEAARQRQTAMPPVPQRIEPLPPTRVEIPDPGDDADKKKEKPKPLISKIEQIESWLMQNYDLRRNLLNYSTEFKTKGEDENRWREMEDEDENDILYQLKRQGFSKPQEDLKYIIGGRGIPTVNPIRDYYSALVPRHPGSVRRLADCIVLDDLEFDIGGKGYRQFFEEYFEKWLRACYLCNMGIQRNDVMLILIGAQGRFKTSFLNHLCPTTMDKYLHCGNINPALNDYNTATYLVERMLINVDDQMENIFGKDYNSMKSIITADYVARRILYSKRPKNCRRIANFCGSVNESHFLRDSNNRRYLCFKIKDIKPEYRDIDMDDVWAEIVLSTDTNQRYIFTREDFANIDIMNENFMTPTEEDEALHSHFAPCHEEGEWTYYMQQTEIMKVLRFITGNNQLRPGNLQTAMRKYGFESRMRRVAGRSCPLNLYAVRLIAQGEPLSQLSNLCCNYRAQVPPSGTDCPY